MDRSDLIIAVTELAERAALAGEHAAATVLLAITLALSEGTDLELVEVVARWMVAGNPPDMVRAA